jgi:hypothetical protein
MHITMILAATALLFTAALAIPTPQQGPVASPSPTPRIITTRQQDPGLNYTAPPQSSGQGTLPTSDDGRSAGQPPLDSCGASTFEDHSSDASPLGDDCLVINKLIADGFKWDVTGSQHQLVAWGTCAFGVESTDKVGGYFTIGNLDVIDIINTSVDRFAHLHDGKVGAAGSMECGGSLAAQGTSHGVQWGIYHT